MGKKSGAGAAKKLAGSSALREDKRIRKLYFSYSFLGKIFSLRVTKKQLFYLFYIFLEFYLTSLRGKEYFAKEPFGAGCFWPLGAGAARKKITGAGAGAAWKKNQEPELLEKKIRSRSR